MDDYRIDNNENNDNGGNSTGSSGNAGYPGGGNRFRGINYEEPAPKEVEYSYKRPEGGQYEAPHAQEQPERPYTVAGSGFTYTSSKKKKAKTKKMVSRGSFLASSMEIRLYAIGAAIRETRKQQNLTQEELGQLVGVQKAQISRIENGKNLTFATVLKLFKAMNISVKLDIDKLGRVALC